MTTEVPIGEVINAVYTQFLELYGDAELAAVATAAVVNDMLVNEPQETV